MDAYGKTPNPADHCVAFFRPETSSYDEAYNRELHGKPTRSAKVPYIYEPSLPMKYLTESGENYIKFKQYPLKHGHYSGRDDSLYPAQNCHEISEQIDPDQLYPEETHQQPIPEECTEPFNLSEYGENYPPYNPADMVNYRGKNSCKHRKSQLFPETITMPKTGVTQSEFLDFSSTRPEASLIYPTPWASRYIRKIKIPVTVSHEDAGKLMAKHYSPKYLKNISGGFFHGPPESSFGAYKTSTADCHTWPIDFHRQKTCKPFRTFTEPDKQISSDTTYRTCFTAKPIEEQNLIDQSKFPVFKEGDGSPQYGHNFWNTAYNLVKSCAARCERDPHYQKVCDALHRVEPVVLDATRTQQELSGTRLRKGHTVGIGSAVGNMPLQGKTTYHEELRWETTVVPQLQKPHAPVVPKLLAPSGHAKANFLSEYKETFTSPNV